MELVLLQVRRHMKCITCINRFYKAWCLSWSFLNAKSAIKSMRPVPIALLAAVTLDTVIYGKKTLKVNGYI